MESEKNLKQIKRMEKRRKKGVYKLYPDLSNIMTLLPAEDYTSPPS